MGPEAISTKLELMLLHTSVNNLWSSWFLKASSSDDGRMSMASFTVVALDYCISITVKKGKSSYKFL